MALLQDLIQQIDDPTLRERILQETNKLIKQKKFGLVFEEHLPECTPLYDVPIRVGTKVAQKTGYVSDIYTVLKIDGDDVLCDCNKTHENKTFHKDEIVAVAEFGEPIYPTLQMLDSVENAPDSGLWHTLIEADNYHALQLLEYLYAEKVDCIYIDPPYNTGAKDWKYNNDYVDSSDAYRHSKWLSMMEKRLKIAKNLLTADGSMVIAIDDYEEPRLAVLLYEIFPEYDISPVIVNHHPQGGSSDNISRTHEYALFVTPKGQQVIHGEKLDISDEKWSLTRGGTDIRNRRAGRPNSFYAIYVNKETRDVVGVGPHLDVDTPYDVNDAPEGCVAFYPIGKDGTERVWRYERASMQEHIENGDIVCSKQMKLQVIKQRDVKYASVFSVWTDGRYNAGTFGTSLLYEMFAKTNRFSYPKSLYSVEDCIKYIVQDKKYAVVLDFFAGSGTTLHAVNLLNAEDSGSRRCIMVTNNEVSNNEAKGLSENGYHPGDSEWEKLGIAHYITWPRTVCSIKGCDIKGTPLKGNYLGSDIPMADGFKSNCAFFKLRFLDKTSVELGRQFKELLPVLWMKGGCIGRCPVLEDSELPSMLVLPENGMAVLIDETYYQEFAGKVAEHTAIQTIFLVTDSESAYRSMIRPYEDKDCYQLYRDYLDNFRINTGR